MFDHFGDRDPLPNIVELAPASDAVKVGGDFDLW